jgi:uncharacterized Tic20 family protein
MNQGSHPYEPDAIPSDADDARLQGTARQWAVLLHLSQFAGYIVPLAGFAAPVIIWQLKKDELPGIDEHGRIVVNWIISEIIYGLVAGLLVILLIGIPLLVVLGVLGVIFPIIGAIKAGEGVAWKYPMSLTLV